MGFFGKIGGASVQRSKNWISDGRYIVRVDAIKAGENRKGDFWKSAMTVMHVLQEPGDNSLGQTSAHAVGTEVVRLRNMGLDGALPEFKMMMCALGDCAEDSMTVAQWEEACDAAVSDDQPFAGDFADVTVNTIHTNSGTLFTTVDWNGAIEATELREIIDDDGLCDKLGIPK